MGETILKRLTSMVHPSLLIGAAVTSLVALGTTFVSHQGMGIDWNMMMRDKPSSDVGSSFRDDLLRWTINPATGEEAYKPSCARDVFVAIHQQDDEDGRHACNGFLLRDDIIVTSSECSRLSNLTFHFSGVGVLPVIPHVSLNDKLGKDSPLGFLEANPPYHHQSWNRPTRRTRMFLSRDSGPIVNGTEAFVTCDEHRPIAHSLPVDGMSEMVPLVQLEGIVPDDILWDHTDIDAPMMSIKSYRWWTRRVELVDEEWKMSRLIRQYTGPPGSISLPQYKDNFVEHAGDILEILDPRGHRPYCGKNYFARWREEEPFSGQSFFDWVDYGRGKHVLEMNAVTGQYGYMHNDETCYKKEWNGQHVHYFNDEERRHWEVYLEPSEDGKKVTARYKRNDEIVPESPDGEPHLYMWTLNKTLIIVDDSWDEDKFDVVKHSGVMAGRPGLSGGKMYFDKDGAIWGINYSSGHYCPDIRAASMMYQWFKGQHLNLTAFHWVGRNSWSTRKCRKADWEGIEIPGFDAKELNRSCYEMAMNPTWMLKDDV